MNIQNLSGRWQFRQSGAQEWMEATVPGGVHTDLLAAGKIPDPFVADNEKKVMWVAESDWEYRLQFTPQQGLLQQERVFLVFDGLDTLAEIRLNGRLLGTAENMFRQYEWEVKQLLQQGENELAISFLSPVKFITEQQSKRYMAGVSQAIDGSPHIRKAPCQFGWDWGPMLPPIGIWKAVRLEGRSNARLDDVHLRQLHHYPRATVEVQLSVEKWNDRPLTARVYLTNPQGQVSKAEALVMDDKGAIQITVEQPILWWPNGYGEQPLYQVEVYLDAGGMICDWREYQIGLRTIELRQDDDQWGRSFTFVVNGVPIFAKGSDWIPADSFPTRLTDEFLEALVRDAAVVHQNMLRVWGGGFYEEERFFDLCDRYGILVWQDCIFSCSIYPLDRQEFLDNVQTEIEQNVRRLRHRASLALWCGNNEMEWGWESWGWSKMDNEDQIIAFIESTPSLRSFLGMLRHRKLHPEWKELKTAYDQFFYTTLPEWIAQDDPDTPYWPSSPSSNSHFADVNSVQVGDTHNWEVWHGNRPFQAYREHPSRFVSEFGFQSLPALETVRTYAEETDWNMTSYIMEHHQRNDSGNGKIINYMTDHFRLPKDFPSLVYLTQLLQAEAVRSGVEFWRRNMARTSGTLYWQLNDCWPVASWASLDYFGRWKALHYLARRFYAPVLLSIEDNGLVMDIHISSDLQAAWEGDVLWYLETLGGTVIESGSHHVRAEPLANTPVCAQDYSSRVSDSNRREVIFICELWQGNQRVALNTTTFAPNKHLELTDPGLQIHSWLHHGDLVLEVSAQSLARYVELSLDADVVFSDNYFDIPAGRAVTVTCPLPQGWSLEQARQALRVRSLYNTYA